MISRDNPFFPLEHRLQRAQYSLDVAVRWIDQGDRDQSTWTQEMREDYRDLLAARDHLKKMRSRIPPDKS